jgi:Nif-specific regulatory protein
MSTIVDAVESLAPDILDALRSFPAAAALAPDLLFHAASSADAESFLAAVLPEIQKAGRLQAVAVAQPREGSWTVVCSAGRIERLPVDLLGEALDRESSYSSGPWTIEPLGRHPVRELLLIGSATRSDGSAAQLAAAVGPVLHQVLEGLRSRQRQRQRIGRLEAILEIALRWNQTHEMEPLLVQMAEAACRLLAADRASIFLWDKANKTLVGRPALGVENNELRIPDNVGVVGQVVQTGQPRRVDRGPGQAAIDRQVDRELGYRTETLLCVPLVGRTGERFGAFEMINKLDGDFTDDDQAALTELAQHAAIALENTQERQALLKSRRVMSDEAAEAVRLIGESPAIVALRSTIQRVARTDLSLLVLGENGTGKEVVSRLVHYLSDRRDQPFVAVNCAAISETLLESELFGHEKGAFTGAEATRPGKFELASGGTLFLDEIGDMSPGGQAKLLRVLEEKVVVRVGGSTPIHVDVRIIAATNQNLFYRLTVVTLDLPPLRQRGEDVLRLAEHFLEDFSRKARRNTPALLPEARQRLLQHTWPGNVRELRNMCERLAYLFPGEQVAAEDLAFFLTPTSDAAPAIVSPDLPLNEATLRFQVEYIKKSIARASGNMSDAARRLGLHRSNLYRKMRQLGMEVQFSED